MVVDIDLTDLIEALNTEFPESIHQDFSDLFRHLLNQIHLELTDDENMHEGGI